MLITQIDKYEVRHCVNQYLPQDELTKSQFIPFMLKYYQQRMDVSRSSKIYEYTRLTDTAIKEFKLGFCDRTLGKQIPRSDSFQGGSLRASLQRLGLLNISGHETLRGCVVVPVYKKGVLTGIYAERLALPQRGAPFAYWLQLENEVVFNVEHISANESLYLFPSAMSCLMAINAGLCNSVAIPPSTEVIRKALCMFSRLGIRNIFVAPSPMTLSHDWFGNVEQAADCGLITRVSCDEL